MTLSIRAMAVAASIIWAGAILITGVLNRYFPEYGSAFLQLVGSVYPGYHAGTGLKSVIVGTLYGLLDGAVCGAIFAWIYNKARSLF